MEIVAYGADSFGDMYMIIKQGEAEFYSWMFETASWKEFFGESETSLTLAKCYIFANAEANQTEGYSCGSYHSAEEALRSMV